MSTASEETHDDGSPALKVAHTGCALATKTERVTPIQESTDVGSKPRFGRFSRQTDGRLISSRKRSLEDTSAHGVPNTVEDEQHSSQSAFQQYRPHSQQQPAQQTQKLMLDITKQQAVRVLATAAPSHDTVHQSSSNQHYHTEVDGPSHPCDSAGDQPVVLCTVKRPSVRVRQLSNSQPCHDKLQDQPWSSRVLSHPTRPIPQSVAEHSMHAASQMDVMYAHAKPNVRISAQLIRDIQRLESPEIDGDSVQAALEFADAVQFSPALGSPHPSHAAQHSSEPVRLLHNIEVGTGRLDVLRILTHSIRSSTSRDMRAVPGGPGQLLAVVQDLLKDMEASQMLLHHAEQAVIAQSKSALKQVDTLQDHHRATREYWLQSQRLQSIAAERQILLQRMMMLPLEPASKELLDLFDKLRQSVVAVLEVSACRTKLSGDMQSAQAQLVAQGVCGVTAQGMTTGAVELVVDRPVRRLQTLLHIIHAIARTRTALLLELAAALVPWQQCCQHMQEDDYKIQLVEAVSQVQARVEGLLHQGCTASDPHKRLAPMQTGNAIGEKASKVSLKGAPAASHTSSLALKWRASCEQPSSHELHRSQKTALGSQAPAGATPGSALPLHIPKAKSSLQSRTTKLVSSSQDLHGSSPVISQPSLTQVRSKEGPAEHPLLKPRAQRPQYSNSGRDPRSQPPPAWQAKLSQSRPSMARTPEEPQKEGSKPSPGLVLAVGANRPGSQTRSGIAQSPEVAAAAQALLHSQLQELGVSPDQAPPQLLHLISALCTASGVTSLPSLGSINPQPTPFQAILSHKEVPTQAIHRSSEHGIQTGKVPKLSRDITVCGHKQSNVAQEGRYLFRQPLQGVPVEKVNSVNGRKECEGHKQQHCQHEAHAQAAAYAQLCAALPQAQGPASHLLERAHSNMSNPISGHMSQHQLAQQ